MQQFSTLSDLAITAAAVAQSDSAGRLIMDADAGTLHAFNEQLNAVAGEYRKQAKQQTNDNERERLDVLALQLHVMCGLIAAACMIKSLDEVTDQLGKDLDRFELTPEWMRSPLEIIKASELLADE